MTELAPCPDCGVLLPPSSGAGHRYVGASAACWELFAALHHGGQPPLASGPFNGLLTDAYMAQHPGRPSPQAIQSVAVHLLALYGVLGRNLPPERALWVRLQAVSEKHGPKHGRYHWLTSPDLTQILTVADIVAQSTPAARTGLLETYVQQVWQAWVETGHGAIVAEWYSRYIIPH